MRQAIADVAWSGYGKGTSVETEPCAARPRGAWCLHLGVLDRLLEETDIEIARISGTSAGALTGAALATGYARDASCRGEGKSGAPWQRVALIGLPFTMLLLPFRKPNWGTWDGALPLISPYVANPLGLGPLRAILSALIDVDALRSGDVPQLYVNAVSANSGANRVFKPHEMSISAILASACAPKGLGVEEMLAWVGIDPPTCGFPIHVPTEQRCGL